MDNNFNQQAPQQPVYQQMPQQQPVYQQAPVQAQYQQAPQQQMYQQPQYQAAPKKPMNLNMMELIALGCAGVAALLAILGTTLTCACSASKSFDKGIDEYSLSPVFILSIFAIIIAAGGIVCAIIALKQKDAKVKAGKMATIAIAVSAFAFIFAFVPMTTICGYNCSLNNAIEDYQDDQAKGSYDDLDIDYEDIYDYYY